MQRCCALIVVTMIFGCQHSTASPVIQPPRTGAASTVEQVTTQDSEVLAATLEDFASRDDVPIGGSSKRLIVVDSRTAGASLLISSDQISFDFAQETWTVPADIQDDLRRRNEKPCSLKHASLGKNVVQVNFDEFDKSDPIKPLGEFTLLFNLQKKYPELRGYASFWLPGYADGGTTAVVRFSFGFTPHGATATYLLVKKDGKWTVQNRHVAY